MERRKGHRVIGRNTLILYLAYQYTRQISCLGIQAVCRKYMRFLFFLVEAWCIWAITFRVGASFHVHTVCANSLVGLRRGSLAVVTRLQVGAKQDGCVTVLHEHEVSVTCRMICRHASVGYIIHGRVMITVHTATTYYGCCYGRSSTVSVGVERCSTL